MFLLDWIRWLIGLAHPDNLRQAVNLWENMIAAGGSRPPQWLSTHPDPQARISELRQRSSQLVPLYDQARAAGRKPNCG